MVTKQCRFPLIGLLRVSVVVDDMGGSFIVKVMLDELDSISGEKTTRSII